MKNDKNIPLFITKFSWLWSLSSVGFLSSGAWWRMRILRMHCCCWCWSHAGKIVECCDPQIYNQQYFWVKIVKIIFKWSAEKLHGLIIWITNLKWKFMMSYCTDLLLNINTIYTVYIINRMIMIEWYVYRKLWV